jgi:hypothetical protein
LRVSDNRARGIGYGSVDGGILLGSQSGNEEKKEGEKRERGDQGFETHPFCGPDGSAGMGLVRA